MKNQFAQSHKHFRFYILCVGILLTLVGYVLSKTFILIFFIGCMTPFIVPYFLTYRIQEDGTLTGGCSIPVRSIRKVVYQKDRLDLYYQPKDSEKLTFRTFYPVDRQGFVDALLSINPDIQVI